jgi:dipeptidyl aminopeptidase/acylaminoacyl peptidase
MKTTFRLLIILMLVLTACKPAKRSAREVKDYSIEQFMSTINMFGGDFSADESRVLITSNKSGVYNIYSMPVTGGELNPLTHSDTTSIFAVSFFPNDDRILFQSDDNGNEVYHIFLLNTDSSVIDLTPGKNARSSFYSWNFDDQSFIYGSNFRDERFMDVYEMDIKSFKPKMIFKNDEGLDFEGISRDEKWMVFTKAITTSNNEMYLYGVTSGKMTHISEHTGNAVYSASGFSNDNGALYFTTNENDEYTCLEKYTIAEGAREKVLEYDWDIWYSYLSHEGKYRVTGINEDARTVIKVFDYSEDDEVEFPSDIVGDIMDVNISRSESLMTFWVGSSKSPSNLFIFNFSTGEARLLASALNPEIDPDDLVEGEVVRYPSFDGLEIPAILYTPHQVSSGSMAPALVWVHGGPGGQSRLSYSALLQYLVNKGYVVIAVNNRGSSGYGKTFYQLDDRNHGENDLVDCIKAKEFLAKTGYVDTSKVGIIGGSYGGFMVMAALTMQPNAFDAGVNLFGVTNWLRTLKSIPPWWESYKAALYDEMGDPIKDSVRLYRISPLFHANEIKKPFIVLQGANDPRVLQIESDEIVEAARANQVEVEYVLFSDEGHGFDKKENQIRANEEILSFLNKHLKGIKNQQEKGLKHNREKDMKP